MVVIGGYNSSNTCNLAAHLRRSTCRPFTSRLRTGCVPCGMRHREADPTRGGQHRLAPRGRAGHGRDYLGGLDPGQPGREAIRTLERFATASAPVVHSPVNTVPRRVVRRVGMRGKWFICLVLSLCHGLSRAVSAHSFKWWQDETFQEELALTTAQVTRHRRDLQARQPTLKGAERSPRQARRRGSRR